MATPPEPFEVVTFSRAPVEKVFEVVADHAGYKHFMPLMVSEIEAPGDPAPNGVGAIRRLGVPGYVAREQVVAYEPPTRLSYTILSGIPVVGYRADVDLEPSVSGGTRITWSGSFERAKGGLNRPLRAFLKLMVTDLARRAAREAERRIAAEG